MYVCTLLHCIGSGGASPRNQLCTTPRQCPTKGSPERAGSACGKHSVRYQRHLVTLEATAIEEGKTSDLTIEWKDVAMKFEAFTGKSLRLELAKTLNDCIDAIEKRQLPPATVGPKAASGIEKAKSFGPDILHCLKLLGGVAAQGADMLCPSVCLLCWFSSASSKGGM